MNDGSHSMTLEEFAELAKLSPAPPHPDGTPVIITPSLADALNTLIEAADEVACGASSRSTLRIALGQLKALHDYESVRLGGLPR